MTEKLKALALATEAMRLKSLELGKFVAAYREHNDEVEKRQRDAGASK